MNSASCWNQQATHSLRFPAWLLTSACSSLACSGHGKKPKTVSYQLRLGKPTKTKKNCQTKGTKGVGKHNSDIHVHIHNHDKYSIPHRTTTLFTPAVAPTKNELVHSPYLVSSVNLNMQKQTRDPTRTGSHFLSGLANCKLDGGWGRDGALNQALPSPSPPSSPCDQMVVPQLRE